MKGVLMYERIEEAKAIYDGDLEKSKTLLEYDYPIIVNAFLGKKDSKEIYRMDGLALILKGDSEHPGHFLKYKKLVDYFIKKHGMDYLYYKHPHVYYKHDYITGQNTYLEEEIPISEQMKVYFRNLIRHNAPERKKVVALLDGIDSIGKKSTPEQKEILRKAKRVIALAFRQKD